MRVEEANGLIRSVASGIHGFCLPKCETGLIIFMYLVARYYRINCFNNLFAYLLHTSSFIDRSYG